MIYLWQRSNRADLYSPGLCFMGNPPLMEFISASQAAMQWASGHFNFPFFPIDLGVMFTEPGMSEQEFLFTKIGDTEGGLLRMIFVMEKEANGFHYWTSFIGGSIHVDRAENWIHMDYSFFLQYHTQIESIWSIIIKPLINKIQLVL